jgi:hypothetical protein
MGSIVPDGAWAELRPWIDRLETDPAWTAHYRSRLAARACEPCALVQIIAPASEYPRAVMRAPVVAGYVLIVGSLAEVMGSGLPIVNAPDMTSERARARALRSHGHALLVEGPRVTAFRFRVR